MKPYLTTKEPDAIEKICIEIENSQKAPMSEEDSMIFIQLSLYHSAYGTSPDIPDSELPPLTIIMRERIKANHQYTLDLASTLFISNISENPAVVVMYCWYLQYWAFKNNVRDINIDTIGMRIFPDGFVTSNVMYRIWQLQKVERQNGSSDNLLDFVTAGKSIQF